MPVAEREFERHEARRGRRFAYESLDPRATALVVVDMVPFFLDESAPARAIVPGLNRLAGALRDAGGTVAWVVPASGPPTPWQVGFYGAEVAAAYAASGGGVDPSLDVAGGDVVVEKSAASAFFPGRSTLAERLDVDTVVVGGTVTSVCVESTVRDAATLGYRVVLLADGCADVSDEAHDATLRTVYRSFGDVRTVAEVLDLLQR